jgi:subfamily B ATP-binding cassette protein MsbA
MNKNYFSRIFSYAWVYKKYFVLNIMSNIFYAFFGTMSMISLFPMLKVLFEQTEAMTTPPVWSGGLEIVGFAEDYLNFLLPQRKWKAIMMC